MNADDLLRRALGDLEWAADFCGNKSLIEEIRAYLDAPKDADTNLSGSINSEAVDRSKDEPVAYGIIDPDYARIFTIARCLAWSEGYAMVMHGSFTRDLDLVAIPWADNTCEPEHLLRRILSATNLRVTGTPNIKPHGRLVWTLLFPDSNDPRFVDFSVVNATTDVVGMEVCLDVSTGEGALDRRIFGRVIDLKQDPEDGPIIYAKEESRNFHPPTKTAPKVPMTPEEIDAELGNLVYRSSPIRAALISGIRMAERHHLIGVEND